MSLYADFMAAVDAHIAARDISTSDPAPSRAMTTTTTPPCGRTGHHGPHELTTGDCPGHTPAPTITDPARRRALADSTRQEIRHG